MKKILFVVIVSLVNNNSSAFEDLQSTSKTEFERCDSCFLELDDMPMDEYTDRDSDSQDDQDLSGYDQNVTDQNVADDVTDVTDNVKPPKISGAQAMIKQILGSLVIHCIAARELAHIYFKEFKDTLAQWYHAVIKTS